MIPRMFSTSERNRRSLASSAASFAFRSVTSANTETMPPSAVRRSVARKQRPSASPISNGSPRRWCRFRRHLTQASVPHSGGARRPLRAKASRSRS
jgi:hypothetical protein